MRGGLQSLRKVSVLEFAVKLIPVSLGKVHFYPHRFTVFKWYENVCVYRINFKYTLHWHIHISVHSMLCYTHILLPFEDGGAKSGHCLSL